MTTLPIDALVARIATDPECELYPPAGKPSLEPGLELPPDLARFYERCGGCALFPPSAYGVEISPPGQLVRINEELLHEAFPDDPSHGWFTIGRTQGTDTVASVDLRPGRLGRCYLALFDRHGIVGGCPVIARSFTELLTRLYADGGDHWYWFREGFESLGDAYDEFFR